MKEELDKLYDISPIDDEDYFESEMWKKHEEWMAYVKKKAFEDYKEFRRHSDIPYGYIKEELEGLEFIESIGFISGFDEVQRYGKTCYQIRPTDVSALKATLSDPYTGWFDTVCFDKQKEFYDVYDPELDAEDEYGYRTLEWDEYVHQRTEWEDCYYGFIAFQMTDGRFWLLYYKC